MTRLGPHNWTDADIEGDRRHVYVTHTRCRGRPPGAQALSCLSESSRHSGYPCVAGILLVKPRAVVSTLSTCDIIPDSSPSHSPKNKQISNFENRWNPEHKRNKVILRTDRLKALSRVEGNRINYNSGRKEGAQLPFQFASGHTLHQTPSWCGGSGARGGCCCRLLPPPPAAPREGL